MMRTACLLTLSLLLAASLVNVSFAPAADKSPEGPAALERKLLGEWEGPACGGDWTYGADGAFQAQHYSPGNNHLSGTWSVRWTTLPPTLVRTCRTSDDPDLVGKTWDVKLVQLDDEALAYQYPDQFPRGHTVYYTRLVPTPEKLLQQELAALQGTWTPLFYEEHGKQTPSDPTRHIIQGDKITVQVHGETVAEGRVVLDATQNPKHLDFQLTSGQTHLMIYVRAGNTVIYSGNRDSKTRPSEFASGTPKGGDYLMSWKIDR